MRKTLLHVTPHPDDEVIGGCGALQRMRDAGWTIVVALVSLGRAAQHTRRLSEATSACQQSGFTLRTADPPIDISSTGDLLGARRQTRTFIGELLDELRPSIVAGPSPHDGHHGHELVGRAMVSALTDAAPIPRMWLWGLWADLAYPTLNAGYDETTMATVLGAVSCYSGEVERNDYVRLVEARAAANAILGAERIFGFGSSGPVTPYADVFTECIMAGWGWELGQPRQLDPFNEPAGTPSGRRIGWWLAQDSPRRELADRGHMSTVLPDAKRLMV